MEYDVEVINETVANPDIDLHMWTYQHAPYISKAIEGVLMQNTHYIYRLIIMDDCSTDGTQEIIKKYQMKYPDRILVALCKCNSKLSFQKEVIQRYSNAEYVASIDGDDYWTDPYKLEKQINFLEKHPEFIGVTGNVKNVDEYGNKQHCDFDLYPFQQSHIFGKENVLQMEMVSHCSSLVFRNFYASWSEADFNKLFSCKMNDDVRISSVLGMLGNIYYSHEIYSDHLRVFTGTSWTANMHGKDNTELMLTMWEDLDRYIYEVFGENIQIAAYREEMKKRIGHAVINTDYVDELTKQKNIARMFDLWMLSKRGGSSVEKILLKKGIKCIAIYGLAELGVCLFSELKNTSIKVLFGMDIDQKKQVMDLKSYCVIDEAPKNVDAVVVTALTTYDVIKKNLEMVGFKNIIALDEILYCLVPPDPIFEENVNENMQTIIEFCSDY